MKRKEVKLRLSPNEEAHFIKEEHERRRKLRLQQVREQQRYIAQQVRQKVEQRRQYELELLEEDLRAVWERQQRERVNKLQRLYQESLSLLGQGHRHAKENEPDLSALDHKEDNDRKAEERFHKALKELKLQRLKNHENDSRPIDARKKALQAERIRSAKVASLPLPPSLPHQDTGSKLQHIVKKCDASSFAATYYHMPETMVDKETLTSQLNAGVEAELEVERLQVIKREEEQKKGEHQEKARLRGRQALRREQLVQDHGRLLVELEHMQQTDLLRRRQKVTDMPRQIFEPLYKRKETEVELQRELEFAFEDMYSGERRVKGDLMSQLVPEPLPPPSTGSHNQDLDVTQDELTCDHSSTSDHSNAEHEAIKQKAKSINAESAEGKLAPRRALKKLLDRIQTQRHQCSERNDVVASPSISTDPLPERESSMDTGSLSSVDKQSAEEMVVSHVLAKQIQEIEEQKTKDEELEREKQAQINFLQQLKQQRLKLEQSLLEAQHDRLKTSTTPTAPINCRPVPLVGNHTRRMEEHRLRLLQQNEIHQNSVEEARQRLEEYQKALRIRYNLPAVPPQIFSDSNFSSTPAVQILPLRCVGAQEKTHVSVEASPRELGPLCPCSDVGIDSKTSPAQVHKSSDSPTIRRQKAFYQLTQNRMRSVTKSHQQTDVSHTNLSVYSSSNLSPAVSLRVDPSTAVSLRADPGPALSLGADVCPPVSLGVDPSPVLTRGVVPSPALFLGVEEAMERPMLRDIQDQIQNVVMQKQQEVDSLRLNEEQQKQKELEQVSQARCKLLKSLLKAMEQSNFETSHFENSQHRPSTTGSRSLFFGHTGVTTMPPVVAAKPPVSRVKLGSLETAPHQLSVIEEVQTPASMSLVTGDDAVTVEDTQENKACLVTARPEQTEQTDSGASPGSSLSDLAQHISSPHSLDSGRGADYYGPVVTSSKRPLECAHKLHHCLSSTISTGSYITTDPELQSQPDSDSVCVETPGSSPSHSQNQEKVSLDEVKVPRTPQLAPVDSTVETLPAEEHLVMENQGQDSFRPLVGQLAEQSLYMADENPGLVQLVGHPSAHSSVIGQLPGAAFTSDMTGWNCTVNHWRDGLFLRTNCIWQSTSQDFVRSEHQLEQSTICAGSQENEFSVEPSTSSGFHQLHAEITNNQMETTVNLEKPEHTEPLFPEWMRAEESSSSGGLFQKPQQLLSQWTPLGSFGVEGILEQSVITLESLTNSSLDIEESGVTEEPGHRAGAQCTEIITSDKVAARMTMEKNSRSAAGVKKLDKVELCTLQQDQVKPQREIRNGLETSAQKRLKAQEFHQKTLQKLRAKQMQR